MAYTLTPKGKIEAEHVSRAAGAEEAFVTYMYENSEPVEIEELIGETRVEDEVGLRVVSRLIMRGYVKEV